MKIMELFNGYDKSKNPQKSKYRSITFDECLKLSYGDKVFFIDNSGKVRQCKINGKVKTWKRDKERIEIPCKYGLYEYFTFTKSDFHRIVLPCGELDLDFSHEGIIKI